ncbi:MULTISPECIES: hypothetical protein [Vibrio]|uniref:hypothetical protein n=1 Tax=Vibrio TaxID=662 RepID=UPI000502307B|nr:MULTISPECIES: hypothetical protein [Vibrio]KFJ89205.1 hypothetical protein IJ23_01925 [Vibrio sp. OY15]MDW1544008.1 hypothetical protein [Vibrio sp. Vb5034]AVF65390.1 hypothetical protein AL541_13795 [Vibrio alginolyticus]AVF74286.1 hypothetical protein AL539_10890 [Vibrio alginolyticus]EGR1560814.1 hypothetical protein [Vibrio alginolyticus]
MIIAILGLFGGCTLLFFYLQGLKTELREGSSGIVKFNAFPFNVAMLIGVIVGCLFYIVMAVDSLAVVSATIAITWFILRIFRDRIIRALLKGL